MTKQQSDYAPHNSENLDEGWNAVREYLKDAILIAFDGCHKIYLAMDEVEASFFRTHYRGEGGEAIDVATASEDPYEILCEWWDESCFLRFISAVWHDDANPNAGFVSLIAQGAGWQDDEEES